MGNLFQGYVPETFYDEMFEPTGNVRGHYERLLARSAAPVLSMVPVADSLAAYVVSLVRATRPKKAEAPDFVRDG